MYSIQVANINDTADKYNNSNMIGMKLNYIEIHKISNCISTENEKGMILWKLIINLMKDKLNC